MADGGRNRIRRQFKTVDARVAANNCLHCYAFMISRRDMSELNEIEDTCHTSTILKLKGFHTRITSADSLTVFWKLTSNVCFFSSEIT